MLAGEWKINADRIQDIWPSLRPETLDVLGARILRTSMSAESLSRAIDDLVLEYPKHRPPRLKAFLELSMGHEPVQERRELQPGDWVSVDARYAERTTADGRSQGRVAESDHQGLTVRTCAKIAGAPNPLTDERGNARAIAQAYCEFLDGARAIGWTLAERVPGQYESETARLLAVTDGVARQTT